MRFDEPLEPLSSRQRNLFRVIAVVCALSRLAARARSLWDWDEALFCLGMRSYDVTLHHPHPPGFPAYIGLGRIARLFIHDDFRALQTINLLAGMLLFPAVFMLARELRLRFTTSVLAATLTAFFPNVWFYGGTAFSDVVSITLVVFAVALLFRGCRDSEAYLGGSLLLAIAIGIRPQNALLGAFPFVLATMKRPVRDFAFAALIGGAVIFTAFGGAIAATGSWDAYRSSVRTHGEYISRVDSFRSPLRPPLWRLVALFFAKQYSSAPLNIITTIFVLVSIIGAIRSRDRSMAYNALTFGPVAIAAWLFLDRYSVNRFSIGYCPMFAIFAADGIARVARNRSRVEWTIGGLLIGAFVGYTLPALTPVRRDIAPSVLAVQAAKAHNDPRVDDLFVAQDMTPFVDYFMPGVRYTRVLDERALILSPTSKTPRLVCEVIATSPIGSVFRRERTALWNIGRRHYFGAAYATVTRFGDFVSGWYPPERFDQYEWRWMRAQSTTMLPPAGNDTLLRLGFITRAPRTVTVSVNGKIIDSFVADGEVQREWHVAALPDRPNRLDIATNRDRALHVRFLSWAPY